MRPRKDGTSAQAPQKRRLTELLVKRQRPAAVPFLIWDTKQAGLVLRVQPGDEAAAAEALGAGAQDYLVRGEVTARLLARSIGGAEEVEAGEFAAEVRYRDPTEPASCIGDR